VADVTELFTPTENLTVVFPTGAELHLVYLREEVTSTLVDPNSQDPHVLATALCRVVQDWDMTRAGDKVLLQPEQVGRLPIAVQQYVFKAIIKDQNVDPK
jgi:hypothetical protein